MKTQKTQLVVGIVLIAVGVAGLVVTGGPGWPGGPGAPAAPGDPGWPPGPGGWGPKGWGWGSGWWGWHHWPMMRGFRGPHMRRPWAWPGPRGQSLPPVAGARAIDIAAGDFSFQPAEITVRAGEVVNLRLNNQGVTVHDLVIPSHGVWLVAPPGASVPGGVRFDRPGEYEFYCSVPGHREAGMTGRIIVTP